MDLKLIHKHGENILPICFVGRNRNQESIRYHKKVMDFWGVPMNYIEGDFSRAGHGDYIQLLINQTLNSNVDYYWFCDYDCIPLRKDFIDILYSKICDKQSIFGPALVTNHRNEIKNHIYAAAFCLSFSKKLYIELGSPLMTDTIMRSDNSQELTWKCQEYGKIVSYMWPTSYIELTDDEMKDTGNVRYWNLGEYHKYGMSTQYGDLIFHGFMGNIKRSQDNFINKCREILGENKIAQPAWLINILNKQKKKERKNEAVIVCVGFSDFLEITLPLNKDKFDNIIVVTTHEDVSTQNYCLQNDVEFFLTDALYRDNALFNKGLAISEAFGNLKFKDVITILDSDIILPDNFKEKLDIQNFDNNKFYGGGRSFIYSYEDLLDYIGGIKKMQDFDFYEGKGNGYLQIFSYEELVKRTLPGQSLYSSNRENIQVDIDVLKRFCPLVENDPNLVDLKIDVIHLGLHSVYKNGRDSARFDYFNNKKFKNIKREEIQEYIKEINK